MKLSRIALLAAIAFTASVFAQGDEDAMSSESGNKKVKFRFSGDVTLNPAWEVDSDWYQPDDGKRQDDKAKAFNMQYGWNANFGLDFKDNFSMDFRLSNPEGYALGQLNFRNGSNKVNMDIDYIEEAMYTEENILRHLPALPNAYFTWKTDGIFSMQGGFLNVEGNTALDLVAGIEMGSGLWTSNSSWNNEYNASQGGLKFGFAFTENFGLNLTTALVSPENTMDYAMATEDGGDHNDFRFILDADIKVSDMVTISPVFQTRSFWHRYAEVDDDGDETWKTSVLLSYGVDADFAFNDVFNLNAGLAMGNLRYNEDARMFGFLMKVAPKLTFGINEVAFNYSLGVESDTYEAEDGDDKEKTTYNDLYLGWYFRMNEHIAFGPAVSLAFGKYTNMDDNQYGLNHARFGVEFVANF